MSVQFRVSWWMWVPGSALPHETTRTYDNKADAMEHYNGLLTLLADHEMNRSCPEHVWMPRVEERTTGEWAALETEA